MVAVPTWQIPELGEWVGVDGTKAVVCGHFPDNAPWDFEVVYLDGDRAISQPVIWRQGQWGFYYDGPSGGCADHYPQFSAYVAMLRTGLTNVE